MSDPRVFFAAERTLLAWVRTALTFMALGFVVARFGLFLDALGMAGNAAALASPHRHALSGILGITLVGLGAMVSIAALINHRSLVHSLPAQDVPRLALPWLASMFALCVVIAAIVLMTYLSLA